MSHLTVLLLLTIAFFALAALSYGLNFKPGHDWLFLASCVFFLAGMSLLYPLMVEMER